jgi:hypothetical protein
LDVRNVAIPLGSGTALAVAGGLTVRKADVPSGRRMTREANAGGRKTPGNHTVMARLPLAAVDNRPDRGGCLSPKGR